MMRKFLKKTMLTMTEPLRACVRHELLKHEQRTQHRHIFRSNIEMELKRRATVSSTDYVLKAMNNTPSVGDPAEMLDFALNQADLDQKGLICEFGVYTGRSINHIAAKTKNTVHGFDSFEGLPEAWYGKYGKGHFAVDNLPDVRGNVKLHKGWFSDTLPGFVAEHPEPLAFLHVDCDLYSSTVTIFEHLGSQIGPGCIILFDEYFNYPGWEDGEYKALKEFVSRKGINYEYIAYSRLFEQVAIRIVK